MVENKHIGICSTCESNKICRNYSNSENPIWYCEEFDIGKNSSQVDKKRNINVDSDKEIGVSIYRGLCINCKNRKICKLQIPGIGVWHCEEYL